MSTNQNAARAENRDALHGANKNIGLTDLDGFQLPVEVTEDYLVRMQNEVNILDLATTMTVPRLEWQVPKFGVPRLSGSARAEEGSRTSSSDADTGEFYFNLTDKQYYILFEPERDALKNTHPGVDDFAELIQNEFVDRWANDVGIIGLRANVDDTNENLESITGSATLDNTWTGWIGRAEGETTTLEDGSTSDDRLGLEDTSTPNSMPTVDMASASVDTQMFNESIQTLDERYRDPDSVAFLMNNDVLQQYAMDLTQREDPLGANVIFGDSDLTPFSYDIIGVNEWPTSYGMLTDPENLAFGLYEEMTYDQTTNSDTVNEQRLHSRNWLEGQFDFQIRDMQAGVLIENIADPTA
jgi:hypothetical protein